MATVVKMLPKGTLKEICGICLRPNCDMTNFFTEPEYITLFQKITDINLLDGFNRVPKRICLDCHGFLEKAKIFRESALRSNEIFHRHSQRTSSISTVPVQLDVKPIVEEIKDIKSLLPLEIQTYDDMPTLVSKSNNIVFETYPYVRNRVPKVRKELDHETDAEKDFDTPKKRKNTAKLPDYLDVIEYKEPELSKLNLKPAKNKLKMKIDKRGAGILKYDPKQTKILIVKKDKVLKSGKIEKKGLKMKRSKLGNIGDVSKAVASGQFDGHKINVLEAQPGYFKAPVMKTLKKSPEVRSAIENKSNTHVYEKIETITDERLLEFDRRMAGIPKYDTERMELIILSDEEVQKEREANRKGNKYVNLPFRCKSCIVGFNFEFKLEKHNKMKHEEAADKLKCDICDTYCVAANLPVHRNNHYFRYQCTKCPLRKLNREGVSIHYEKEHMNTSYTCEKCGKVSQTMKRHMYHMKTHGPRSECHICGRTYRDKFSLSGHLLIHEHGKLAATKRYKQTIPETDPETGSRYYCKPCNVYFKNKMIYVSHVKRTVKHAAPDTLRFECKICQAKFISRANMQYHVKWVHDKIGVSCPHCGKAFPNPTKVRQHVRFVHQMIPKPRNNLCDICGKGFTTKELLRRHRAIHFDLRAFKCTECTASFKQDAARRTHYQLVHRKVKRPPPKKKQHPNILIEAAEMADLTQETFKCEVMFVTDGIVEING